MLLTIRTTARPATDLGYLLHKHPARLQFFELSFGHAHVFYPEAVGTAARAWLGGLRRSFIPSPSLRSRVNATRDLAREWLERGGGDPSLRSG